MTRKINVAIERWHNDDADDDGGRWSYRGTTSGLVTGVYESTDDYDFGYSGMKTELTGDLWAVYAEYMTGDTFGSDYEACVVGVFDNEDDALALMNEAEKFENFGSLSNGFYVPWNGYFERLIGLHVEPVQKKSHHRRY